MLADSPHLAAQPERGDQSAIALWIGPVEILEHAAALADHLEQAAARVVVVLVGGQVLSEILDAARQDGDLHLRRAGIPFVGLILRDDLRLVFRLQRHAFRLPAHSSTRVGGRQPPPSRCATDVRAHARHWFRGPPAAHVQPAWRCRHALSGPSFAVFLVVPRRDSSEAFAVRYRLAKYPNALARSSCVARAHCVLYTCQTTKV